MLQVETITNGPFMENCFIAADPESREGVLIDPGDEAARILDAVRKLDIKVTRIVATHGHVDHAGAVAPLKRMLGVPFAMHPADQQWLDRMPHQAAMFGLPEPEVPQIDQELSHGDVIRIGSLDAKVLHTPGHSEGGICLHVADARVVFAGDPLFAGSIGRTDLPGGSYEVLIQAIQQQLLALDDEVTVHCGHGPSTRIGAERRHNPFLQPGAPGTG